MLAGRRVRCPECDTLVEVAATEEPIQEHDDPVLLEPIEMKSGDTVMLEAVEYIPPAGFSPRPVTAALPPTPPAPPQDPDDEEPPQPKKAQLVETEMDMTPMVDATFQLLIFFMITAAFALQKSKEIPKPESKEPSTNVVSKEDETAAAVIVRIDEFNSFLVIDANGDEMEAPSVFDLHARLRKAHEGDSEGRVPTRLRVEAHEEALHERVITAIDAGNEVGFAEVQLASIEDDV